MSYPVRPKTSVIIPVYNTEKYLPACLDSVLAQTQHDIEVILVDDGSTDGSIGIERAYAERDSRVRVIQQPNLRQGTARNRGLAEAHGEYVYFMDSDDFIVPEHFEVCYRTCKENNLDFATFDSAGFVDDPNVERPELFHEINDRRGKVTEDVIDGPTFWMAYYSQGFTPFICWLEYFDRSFLVDNDLRFVEGIYFEDNDWIVRVFMAAKRVKYVPLKLHRYRERPESNVHAGFTQVLAESCFDVHGILCDLARSEKNPIRLNMIQNVSFAVDFRFTQFADLEPTERLRELTLRFVEHLLKECACDSLPLAVRTMHLNTMVSLAKGVPLWPNPPVVFTKSLAQMLLHFKLPAITSSTKLGIYGTGEACQALFNAFDIEKGSCFFIESEALPNQVYRGEPVTSIRDAQSLDLDAIIITSSKFAEEMKSNVVHYLGEEMPVYIAPPRTYLLADGLLADQLAHS